MGVNLDYIMDDLMDLKLMLVDKLSPWLELYCLTIQGFLCDSIVPCVTINRDQAKEG